MGFRCEVYIQIKSRGEYAEGTRFIELPFAPWQGLVVYGLGGGHEGVEVERCVWMADSGHFLLSFGGDFDESSTFEEIKESWGEGWSWGGR